MVSPTDEVYVVISPTNITDQPTQALPVPVVQPSPNNLNRFLQAQPKALGVVQIMIGLMHLGWWYGMADVSGSNSPINILPLGSLFYIISGSYSVAAENKLTRTRVKCSLGMNIVSCPFAVFEILLIIAYYRLVLLKPCEKQDAFTCERGNAFKLGVSTYLMLFIVLEIGIVLSTSAFACKVLCCNTGKPPVSLPLEASQTNSLAILSEQPYEVLTSPPAEYSTLQ